MAYDFDLSTAQFFCGRDFGFQHGVYPPVLRSMHLRKAKPDTGRILVFWFPPKAGAYPTMHTYMSSGSGETPNGGVAMDLDYGHVATFGVYVPDKAGFKGQAWYDFDHWPVIGLPASGNILAPGLANGHYHAWPGTAAQHPVTDIHRQMLTQVVAWATHHPPV